MGGKDKQVPNFGSVQIDTCTVTFLRVHSVVNIEQVEVHVACQEECDKTNLRVRDYFT